MPKLIVVSNRLPVSLSPAGELTRSSGGLVSALSSLSAPFLWVGSLGSGGSVDEAAKASLAASGCLAVEMPEKVYEAYYVSAPSPRRYRSTPSARAPLAYYLHLPTSPPPSTTPMTSCGQRSTTTPQTRPCRSSAGMACRASAPTWRRQSTLQRQ